MNQLAVIEHPQPQVPAFALSDLERIATAIARGGMFGSKDPHAVLTLCMLAQAEGQHPAVVFRDYDIIQGKPAKKAEAMLRDFIRSGGKVTWNRLDDECADATFSHPQGGEVTINWTMARAQKAQLGGKDMWKKYPRQMLRSRVVSEGVRTVCPNATSGLYVPEEVRDFTPDATPSDTPPTPAPKRARDLKAQKPTPPAIEHNPETGEIIEGQKTDAFGLEPVPTKSKAEEWTEGYLSSVEDCATIEDLMALQAKSANALAKLKTEKPELHEQAVEAGVAKAAELQNATAEEPFDA
jgi:hypothetical protein